MLEYIYRPEDQVIFTGREYELDQLERHLLGDRPADLHLSGLRRIGKSMLIKEFIRRHSGNSAILPVYINMEELSETPEDFAVKFIGWQLYWLYGKGESLPLPFLQLSTLIFQVPDQTLREALQPLMQEMERARPDRQRLLQAAFAFPALVAKTTGKRVLLFLDEFQEIAHLTNFSQAKNVLKLLRGEKDRSANVIWCICGSIISEMEAITRESRSPLFGQFSHISLHPYTRTESDELIHKFIQDSDNRLSGLLHHYSAGSPFYLVQLLRRLNLFRGRGESLTENLVKRAFVSETLSPSGSIHAYCTYLYNISLQRAKGYGVLRAILDLIAVTHEPMSQSELARRLRMTQGAVRTNLKELERIGLLHERHRRYYYIDGVLRYWVAYVQFGVEAPEFPGERDMSAIMAELDRKYQQVATELGKSREEEIRELLRRFDRQRVAGHIFGLSDPVLLPCFSGVASYRSADGRVEVDDIGQGTEIWAMEVKWKGKAVGRKLLEKFRGNAAPLADKLWYVAKAGFTAEAREYATETGMLLSSSVDVDRLRELLDCGLGHNLSNRNSQHNLP
jgi:AAA+ ATPase superfamily predicted ATPase